MRTIALAVVCIAFIAGADIRSAPHWPLDASRSAVGRLELRRVHAGLLAQPRNIDPVEAYLSSLPLTNATFPALRSADAGEWAAFFKALPGAAGQLTTAVRRLEAESKTAQALVEDAARRAKAAQGTTRRATSELVAANQALLRARQRSGAASLDTQRQEDRVERAQEAQTAAQSEEQSLLERVGQLERQRLQQVSELNETRTALQRATARIDPPQLGAIANRELKIGNHTVVVKNHSDVSDVIGVADCEGTNPIILLAPRPTQPISNASMMFFREHEMAHHVLRHIDCSRGQTVRSGGPEQEIEADCEAAKTLIGFQDGMRVVDIVFGHFWTWNKGASATHPSSRGRANAMFTQCK